MAAARPDDTVVVVGGGRAGLDPIAIPIKELRVLGSFIYAEQGIDVGHSLNRRTIQHVLRTHHTTHSATSSAHPEGTFHIPNWSGAQPLLASAALSNLLDNAL